MNEEALVKRKMDDWARLEQLCLRADVTLKSLSQVELFEFIRLYRTASSDLALIRTRSENAPLADYLNNILGRANGILYRSPRKAFLQSVSDTVLNVVLTFRRNKSFFWTSFSIFFAAAVLAFFLVQRDPGMLRYFGANPELFDEWKRGEFDARSGSRDLMATFFYAGNNPMVSIIAGAVGAGTMGLYSLVMLFQNGALIGSLGSEMHSVNKLFFLISSIIPHGVPELMGIIFSGAAGLKFGHALIVPGRLSRGQSLKKASKDGITMIVTGVLLCFIAAPIEGFFSFKPEYSQGLKLAVGIVGLVFWTCFFNFYGKSKAPVKDMEEVKAKPKTWLKKKQKAKTVEPEVESSLDPAFLQARKQAENEIESSHASHHS